MDCIREMSLNSYSIDASFPKVSYFTNAFLDTFGNEKFPKRDLAISLQTNMTNIRKYIQVQSSCNFNSKFIKGNIESGVSLAACIETDI